MNLSNELVCAVLSFLPRTPSVHMSPAYALHSLFDTKHYRAKFSIVIRHLNAFFYKNIMRNARIRTLVDRIYVEDELHSSASLTDIQYWDDKVKVARLLHDAAYLRYRAAICMYMTFPSSPTLSRRLDKRGVTPLSVLIPLLAVLSLSHSL